MKKHLLIVFPLVLGCFSSNTLIAQPTENVPPRLQAQQDDYERKAYLFPAQKKSNWAVGLRAGASFVGGDVAAMPGYNFGINVQKALGHAFSIRGVVQRAVMAGQNHQSTRGYYSGLPAKNAWATVVDVNNKKYWNGGTTTPSRVFYNFRNESYDAMVQGVLNLNNINFYKEQSKWNLYGMVGAGLTLTNTRIDALDDQGRIFDFAPIIAQNNLTRGEARREVFDARGVAGFFGLLNSDRYESANELNNDTRKISFGSYRNATGQTVKKQYFVLPNLSGGAGIGFKLTRRIELNLEETFVAINSDLMDGQRWQEQGGSPTLGNTYGSTALSPGFDVFMHTNIALNVRLGKGEESMWWSNPAADAYRRINDIDKKVTTNLEDSDRDGVADLFDLEADTPEGMEVDTHGRTIDSDGDGLPDSDDLEKYTRPGCDVDNRGVAKDGDKDGVPDCLDKELNTPAGSVVDAQGQTIKMPTFSCKDCNFPAPVVPQPAPPVVMKAPCELPSVHFDQDRSNIKQEFYPTIFEVGKYMINHPTERVRISGFTDRGGEEMIRKRIDAVINFLVGNFGIDRNRFEIAYGPIYSSGFNVGGGNSYKNPKNGPLDYMNRRVDFDCISK